MCRKRTCTHALVHARTHAQTRSQPHRHTLTTQPHSHIHPPHTRTHTHTIPPHGSPGFKSIRKKGIKSHSSLAVEVTVSQQAPTYTNVHAPPGDARQITLRFFPVDHPQQTERVSCRNPHEVHISCFETHDRQGSLVKNPSPLSFRTGTLLIRPTGGGSAASGVPPQEDMIGRICADPFHPGFYVVESQQRTLTHTHTTNPHTTHTLLRPIGAKHGPHFRHTHTFTSTRTYTHTRPHQYHTPIQFGTDTPKQMPCSLCYRNIVFWSSGLMEQSNQSIHPSIDRSIDEKCFENG